MTNRGFALLFIVLLAGSGIVFAQSNTGAEQLYSSGVHAFNSQRYAEAISWFDQLETRGTHDPRAFFFRGLAHSRSGDVAAANTDFETAARMELTVAGRSFSVPKALERIQGRERAAIEQHRRAAKRTWDAEENVRRQKEFERQQSENKEFFQTIIESGESALPPAPSIAGTDQPLPFGAQPATPFVAKPAFRPRTVTVINQGEMTDTNPFSESVNRVPVIEEPEEPVKPRTRQQDPSERGVFDHFDSDGEVEGFDSSALLQGGGSANPRSGSGSGFSNFLSNFGGGSDDFDNFGSNDDTFLSPSGGFGDGFDDDPFGGDDFGSGNMSFATPTGGSADPVKEGGRSFGKGFASLFKSSGRSTTPSGSPAATPTNPAPAPGSSGNEDVNPFDDDPFGDSL